MATETSPSQAITKAILASQLICLPFTCSLTSLVLILGWRYMSQTSPKRIRALGYLGYPLGSSRPTRVVLARASVGLVASICVILTVLELWHSYQANVTQTQDSNYLQKTSWAFSLAPILTVIVNCTTQAYFSNKACKDRLTQRLLSLLSLLGTLSLVGGLGSTITMIARLSQSSESQGTSTPEKLFWIYLISTALSSLLISYNLVSLDLKERRALKSDIPRKLTITCGTSSLSELIRAFILSYALVFVLQLSCLLSACASLSSNFTIALQASQALFFLQRLTVFFMSISLVCLLRAESASGETSKNPQQVQFHKVYDAESKHEKPCEKQTAPHRPRRPSEVDVRDVGTFDLTTYKHTVPGRQSPLSEEEEEIEDIFSDNFPSDLIVVTEDCPLESSVWQSATIIPALLSLPEKAVGEFTALPGRKSSQLARKKQQTMSPMRHLQLLSDTVKPTRARLPDPKVAKFTNKSKKRKSQIKYIISSPIENKQSEGFCTTDHQESKTLLGL